jgi:dTDP-4-dehydrorhamnose reductase
MNILVTGSRGQLGSELKAISHQKAGQGHTFFFTHSDLLDLGDNNALKEYLQTHSIDCIIHCAAYTAVDKAETDKATAEKVNVLYSKNLANLAREFDLLLIQISSDFVFDGMHSIPYKESDPTNPLSVYGSTKLAGEKAIIADASKYLIIRTSWLYSTFGNNFVKTMMKLGMERSELNIIFDQIGTPTYAADLAAAILAIIPQYQENLSGVYHYSNEGCASWYDFAHEIMALSKIQCTLHPIETHQYPTPATRPKYSILNKGKIKSAFQLQIPHWKDSLSKCIHALKS